MGQTSPDFVQVFTWTLGDLTTWDVSDRHLYVDPGSSDVKY